jgi:hypothetical protein
MFDETSLNEVREYRQDNRDDCVRIRNKAGKHVASLLPCGHDDHGTMKCWDIATPDGSVLYCGVDNDLMTVMVDLLGWESIEKNKD